MSIEVRGGNAILELLADSLEIHKTVAFRAINRSLTKTRTLTSKKIREDLNLKASYVKSKLRVEKATRQKLSGKLVANSRGLLLSRFSPKRLTSVARYGVKGYQALSDQRINLPAIAKGKKPKAISFKVKRSGSRLRRKLFAMRLRRGDENGQGAIGLMVRTGKGKKDYKVLYGPSVSQAFNTLKDELEVRASDFYLLEYRAQFNYEFSKL